MIYSKTCGRCGKEYSTSRSCQRFCDICLNRNQPKQEEFTKNCFGCGIVFKTRIKKQIFHNNNCCETYKHFLGDNLSKRTKGTVSELIVASDLLRKGYKVYQPFVLYDHDLIIEKDNIFIKVEVKTGFRNGKGNYVCGNWDKIKAPLLAVAMKENKIAYIDTNTRKDIRL